MEIGLKPEVMELETIKNRVLVAVMIMTRTAESEGDKAMKQSENSTEEAPSLMKSA